MTNPNYTDITFVIDRSGSMESSRERSEDGFREFCGKQRSTPGYCAVTLYQFDDRFETVYTERDISVIPPMQIVPRGMTALYDAIGRGINLTGERLAKKEEVDRPEHVLFVIVTDGYENASTEYTADRIREMIEHQESVYSWGFVFIGSDPRTNTYRVGSDLGLKNAIHIANTDQGSAALFNSLSENVTKIRRGMKSKADYVRTSKFFDDQDYEAQVDAGSAFTKPDSE